MVLVKYVSAHNYAHNHMRGIRLKRLSPRFWLRSARLKFLIMSFFCVLGASTFLQISKVQATDVSIQTEYSQQSSAQGEQIIETTTIRGESPLPSITVRELRASGFYQFTLSNDVKVTGRTATFIHRVALFPFTTGEVMPPKREYKLGRDTLQNQVVPLQVSEAVYVPGVHKLETNFSHLPIRFSKQDEKGAVFLPFTLTTSSYPGFILKRIANQLSYLADAFTFDIDQVSTDRFMVGDKLFFKCRYVINLKPLMGGNLDAKHIRIPTKNGEISFAIPSLDAAGTQSNISLNRPRRSLNLAIMLFASILVVVITLSADALIFILSHLNHTHVRLFNETEIFLMKNKIPIYERPATFNIAFAQLKEEIVSGRFSLLNKVNLILCFYRLRQYKVPYNGDFR